MVGARPVEGVGPAVVGDADVSHFGMARAVERAAGDDGSPSDARADGDIDQAVEVAAGSPAVLPEGGRVDVGVERDRQPQSLVDWANHVGVPPAGLGRRGDAAIGRRVEPQVEGAERAYPDGGQGRRPVVAQEEIGDPGEGLGRPCGRDAYPVADVVRPRADRTVHLASARLYRAKEHGFTTEGIVGMGGWHARQDSNPRHSVPKTDALSPELRARAALRCGGVSEGIRTLDLQGHNLAP